MKAKQPQANTLQNLLDFLDQLKERKIYYTLGRSRDEAIMVHVVVPGERWEVEFFADGEVEVEVFRATDMGVVGGVKAQHELKRLMTDFAD